MLDRKDAVVFYRTHAVEYLLRPSMLRHQQLNAIDVESVSAVLLSWQHLRSGVNPDELPQCRVAAPNSLTDDAAVLSWRWDRSNETGRSINLGLALKYCREHGIRFLFVDVISIDQTLPKSLLLSDVLQLQDLFRAIPVIAAYDEQAVRPSDLGNTLQRPWILSELRVACQNPTRVTYIGYRYESGQTRSLSFANELSVIRSTGYADCILDILHGKVRMTDEGDLAVILSEYSDILSACHRTLSRGDYLLATFLLTAMHEKSQVVEDGQTEHNHGFRTSYGVLQFDRMGLQRFTLGPYTGHVRPYESARTLQFDGAPVAIWRSIMTSSFDRNWLEVFPAAASCIMGAIGVPQEGRETYETRHTNRTAFLRISKTAPTPAVSEYGISLGEEKWLECVPDPQGTTLGFNPKLWRR